MKTIRNNVFETNSSSMHSFCISNNEPSITQFNDQHIKIDASGEYGWGPVEVKVKLNDISVQEYQNMVKDLDTYTFEEDILTIRMSEQDFYRWYYERHEATISASSSSSIESKNG